MTRRLADSVGLEETEETVEVTEEEDDTDVSELLPEFNSSCIVDISDKRQ